MKIEHILLLIGILLCTGITSAQKKYGIKFPDTETEREQQCDACIRIFNEKPKEVGFSIEQGANNTLFFEINDKKWFTQIFKNSGDGIAIDIVTKDRYTCENPITKKDKRIKGELLAPIYARALLNGLKPYKKNIFRVAIGSIPQSYNGKEVEFNILFLNRKYTACQYFRIFDLPTYPWELLDMGLYLDSLDVDKKSPYAVNDQRGLKQKSLQFIIPFKQDKSKYSQKDIKPLYDSLRLTDYTIKKINIHAYASVEGTLDRNIELQEQRAKSIVTALQSFQKASIVTTVSTSENWVEFLNDIRKSPYQKLKKLDKATTKIALQGATAIAMEPILKNHRKAVIALELEKKDTYENVSVNQLIKRFNTSIEANQMDELAALQQAIFEKLKHEKSVNAVLNKMEIPSQPPYVGYLNKNTIFSYQQETATLMSAYKTLEELEELAPKNSTIKYNKAVLIFKLWRNDLIPVNHESFRKEIIALKKYDIPETQIQIMLLNYHIMTSALYLKNRDYKRKDRSINYIYTNYKKLPLSDTDYLSLAQYFSYYSNYDRAIRLLETRAKDITVDEDLLFYYLNLTIVDDKRTQDSNYRAIMLNAINRNKTRFCTLFNAYGTGGIAFQLLDNPFLRDTYCENCTGLTTLH